MITASQFDDYKRRSDKIVETFSFDAIFDHYGVKAPNASLYDELCERYGTKTNEVILSNRRVATVVGDGGVFEILEPKKDEYIKDVFIDHISYRTTKFETAKKTFEKILAEFDFGQTKGIKVEIDGIIIEIRNDKLTESSVD
jgi:hypothetical protein